MSVRLFTSSACFEKYGMPTVHRTGRLRGALMQLPLANAVAPGWCPIPQTMEFRKGTGMPVPALAGARLKLASAVN